MSLYTVQIKNIKIVKIQYGHDCHIEFKKMLKVAHLATKLILLS